MTELISESLQFKDTVLEATGCEDITFDLETPRDEAMPDGQVYEPQTIIIELDENKSDIPSILITEPSSICLLDDNDEEKYAINVEETNKDLVGSNNPDIKTDDEDKSNDNSLDGQEYRMQSVVITNDVDEKGDKVDISYDTNSTEINNVKDDTTVKDLPELIKGVPDILSESKDDNEAECIEADELVSLDNIVVQDKTGSDSDSEFDFDLPSTTQISQVNVCPVPKSASPVNEIVPKVDERTADKSSSMEAPEETRNPSSTIAQKPAAIIKPASVAPVSENVHKVPTAETTDGRVLEAAQAEWDNVTTVQAGFKDTSTGVSGVTPTVVNTVKPIYPQDLIQAFREEDFSNVKNGIPPHVERHGFAAFVNFLFGPPKLHSVLSENRDRILWIAASQLNNTNETHIRTLQTIYKCLTGSKFDCPRFGGHWEEIGFQGTDPGTDLRGAGLLGLLNLLYLLKDPHKAQLGNDIYRLSLHPTQNFPFCIMGINLSRITLQAFREGLLNKECNRRSDVFGVVNDFYVALYLQLYQVWKSQGKTIADSGFVIKKIEVHSKKNPRDVMKQLDDYLNKKTKVTTSAKTGAFGNENFVNICDDK